MKACCTQAHLMKVSYKLCRNLNTLSNGNGINRISNGEITGQRSTVSNVSGNRCESDCRSRGREFDLVLVLYLRGDSS